MGLTMYETNQRGFFPNPFNKAQQIVLTGMGRVAADGFHTGGNRVFLIVHLNIPVSGTVLLNFPPDGAFGLIADEENIRTGVLNQGFKIVDDATATAHPACGNNDSRASGVFQIVNRAQMLLMIVDSQELLKAEGMTTSLHSALGFAIPTGSQGFINFGKLVGQGRIDNDVQIFPRDPLCRQTFPLSMNDLLDFVEQLLGSTNTKSRDQDCAPIFEAAPDLFLQSLHAFFSAGVSFVAVGTFQNHCVCTVRRLRRGKQGGIRSAQVTRKDDRVALRTTPRFNFNKG
jgi:hypothetical protein